MDLASGLPTDDELLRLISELRNRPGDRELQGKVVARASIVREQRPGVLDAVLGGPHAAVALLALSGEGDRFRGVVIETAPRLLSVSASRDRVLTAWALWRVTGVVDDARQLLPSALLEGGAAQAAAFAAVRDMGPAADWACESLRRVVEREPDNSEAFETIAVLGERAGCAIAAVTSAARSGARVQPLFVLARMGPDGVSALRRILARIIHERRVNARSRTRGGMSAGSVAA